MILVLTDAAGLEGNVAVFASFCTCDDMQVDGINSLHFVDSRPLTCVVAAPLLQLQLVAVGWGSWRWLGQSVSGLALGAPST